MLTIGVDPDKQTHAAFAVNELGVEVAQRTVAVRREGFEQLLEWGRQHAVERSWVIEDVRNVSGSLERFLLDHGETVVRLAPQLMADACQGMRERGKSDPIDALAIARAALREGSTRSRPLVWTARSWSCGCSGCIASGSYGNGPG
jgi:transposase